MRGDTVTGVPAGCHRDTASDGALMGAAAVLIWNDVVPEGRDRFYAWHDNEHVPERLSLPGFRRGRRFERAGHSPQWLTMYEADDVSALVSPQYVERLNAPTPATVRTLEYFRNTSRAVCRVAHSTGGSTGGHMLAMRLGVEPAKRDAMCAYLRDDAFPRARATTGVVACHLFASDESASYLNTAESSTRAFDVPAWVLLCEASTGAAAQAARDVIETAEWRRLGVTVRPDAAVYALEICRIALTQMETREVVR
ncbi:MAG TPA: hypothetical protein VN707_03375 [Casimicrobiaceae bacterium]|nr:hypothetical protein [Casimicrobiaceae bacterium]